MQQHPGQPTGLIPGAAGAYPQAMAPTMQALLAQPAQMGMAGHAILAQRLAVLPAGARGGLATANPGYRGPQMPMGPVMLQKPPNRKAGTASTKGRKSCNCKNSKCLKLYCECFASGRYCDNCNCISCFNNKESEAIRQSAVESILERNPNAFRPKIQTAEGDTHPQSIRNAPDGSVRHTKGCNCKKSSCLKKYCECFQGGIFCTDICKCVDCKNYDAGAAAAAAVAAAAAQQQALKRPRLQLPPQPVMQQQPMQAAGGFTQAHALQQLTAAASAAPPTSVMQPLQQQLDMLSGPVSALPSPAVLPPVSAALTAAAPAAAANAAAAAADPSALQQLQRPPYIDAVYELVKPEMVEELCSLLVIVAQEQADKHAQQPQPPNGSSQLPANGLCNGVKLEDDEALAAAAAAKAASASHADGMDADGDSVMQEDGQQQQQQPGVTAVGQPAAHEQQDMPSELYVAQEGVVLQEFNAILQRILSQADKKASSMAASNAGEAAVAAGDLAAAATGDTADSSAAAADALQQPSDAMLAAAAAAAELGPTASAAVVAAGAALDAAAAGQHLHQQQQQQFAEQQDLQQHLQQLEQQQQQQQQQLLETKPLASVHQQPVMGSLPQQQQAAFAAQQALMLQAAAANSTNLALLQASRGFSYLPGAQGQQLMQPLMLSAGAAGAGGGLGMGMGMGMQLPGLAALRPAGLQMVQVMAQDGTLHQVPAQALMSLQMAAAGLPHQQAAGQPAAAMNQAAAAAAGQSGAAAALPAGSVQPAVAAAPPVQQPISLLSLLNGSAGS